MIGWLLINLAVAGQDNANVRDFAKYRYPSQKIARWQQEAARQCARSYAVTECQPSYMAAQYSEFAKEVCRVGAGQEFAGRHGGTTTSFAQEAIRTACADSIELCRSAWGRFYSLARRDRNEAPGVRAQRAVEQNLELNCGA